MVFTHKKKTVFKIQVQNLFGREQNYLSIDPINTQNSQITSKLYKINPRGGFACSPSFINIVWVNNAHDDSRCC